MELRTDQTLRQESISATIRNSLLFTFGALLIGLLVSFLTAKSLTDPLYRLIDTMKRIRKGDKEAVADESGVAEVGQLSHEFNLMLDTLKQNEAELNDYKNHLEEKVSQAVSEIQNLNDELEATQKEVIYMMGAAIDERSHETGLHVVRVAEAAKRLATLHGVEADTIDLIYRAAPMHDIGKVAIPDAILNKPGKLTDDEMAMMKTHSQIGYDILKYSKRSVLQMAAIIAQQHHERFDGLGYPNGLKGKDIHIAGRVCALADVFDALSHERVYKPAWEPEQVRDYFREQKGKAFDPDLAELFLQNFDDFLDINRRFKDE